MKILMIIPAYNEQDSILGTVEMIKEYNQNTTMKVDYVVINDGSTDKTEKILKKNRYWRSSANRL